MVSMVITKKQQQQKKKNDSEHDFIISNLTMFFFQIFNIMITKVKTNVMMMLFWGDQFINQSNEIVIF